MRKLFLSVILLAGLAAAAPDWTFGPFVKNPGNPVLAPRPGARFTCPVSHKVTEWDAGCVYNPAAIIRDGKVYLLYRAEGMQGDKFDHTSRIGLAVSDDGINFTRQPAPVLYPDNDAMKKYEWPGGIEDPRIVQDEAGTYYLTYSAYNGKLSRLSVASSTDLVHWRKHGPVFARAYNGRYRNYWSKSGAIVTAFKDGRQVAVKINGKYWMYWGDSSIFLATSDDLINWAPVETDKPRMKISDLKDIGAERLFRALETRPGSWDSDLVESGPPAILTPRGIVLIYNSANKDWPSLPAHAYSAGQALFDPADPRRLLDRTADNFIRPELPFEKEGLVDNVVFVEAMVRLADRWLIYFGGADKVIGAAVAPAE